MAILRCDEWSDGATKSNRIDFAKRCSGAGN